MRQKEKKWLKHSRIVSLIMAVIVLVLSIGCQRPMTTKEREERLKELLKDKYGEEFEVRDLYVTGAVDAWCYPVNDPTMIFEVGTMSSMEEIAEDDYLQNIVGRQIDEKFQTDAEEAFGNCIFYTHIPLGSTNGLASPRSDTVTLETLLEYEKEKGFSNSILIDIYVEYDPVNENNVLKEYRLLKRVGEYMDLYGVDGTVTLFFGDYQFVEDIKTALGKWRRASKYGNDNIHNVLKNKVPLYLGFSDGKPIHRINDTEEFEMVDLQKYMELKKEALE